MDKIDMEDSSWIDNLIKEHQKSKNILNNINTFKFRAKRVKQKQNKNSISRQYKY